MHNKMPSQSITGGDFGGGHDTVVHCNGGIVSSETLKVDTVPVVWIGILHEVHDSTPLPNAWDESHNCLDLAASQPDGKPTPGILYELPTVEEVMYLPLP